MRIMRAKVQVQSVTKDASPAETVKMTAVSGKAPYGKEGESEDNTFARFTPSAEFTMRINNPELAGKVTPGMKLYVDFSEAPE